MYSNRPSWVIKEATLLGDNPEEVELARGESDDLWVGVGYEPNTKEVYVANSRGGVYQVSNRQLVLRHDFDVPTYDISVGADSSVWLLYLTPDGDLQMAEIDFERNDLINVHYITSASIFDTPTASFAWDRYGYYAYFQMEGPSRGLFRYDPLTAELTQLCGESYSSHGMFFNMAGEAYIGRSHGSTMDIPLVTYSPFSGETCNQTELVYQPATNFQSYKFDAAEVCLTVVAVPNPPPPAPVPSPEPIPEQPVPPPPEVPVPPAPQPPTQGGTGGAGGSPENDNTVVESAYSTLVLGGAGASVVGCFALFAVVVGMNNTKKEPVQPAIAVLVEDEMMNAAAENPTYFAPSGANENILSA